MRLDLSVLYHIRPFNRPLFNRQETKCCQQFLIVYPVRTIVDSDTESEGRSRPATPPPDEVGDVSTVRAEGTGGSVMGMELADSPEDSGPVKRKKKWTARRLTKRNSAQTELPIDQDMMDASYEADEASKLEEVRPRMMPSGGENEEFEMRIENERDDYQDNYGTEPSDVRAVGEGYLHIPQAGEE